MKKAMKMRVFRKWLLRLALGSRTYRYMCRTLSQDPRLPTCKLADIVVRKDGGEVRVEADWLKTLVKIVADDLTAPVPQPYDAKVYSWAASPNPESYQDWKKKTDK